MAANNIYEKQLTATYGRIKFEVDGKDVTKEIEDKYDTPAFTVDGRSYAPVRAIAELMGLEIKYDDSTHTAKITDVKSDKYETEIKKKDQEIAKLKKEIAELEKKVEKPKEEEKVEKGNLKDLERRINNGYGTYRDIEFDTTLRESGNNITASIKTDFINAKNEYYWTRIGNNTRKELVENITDMIAREFPNADISGEIYDVYTNRYLLTFTKKKNGNVSISHRSNYVDDRYIYDNDIVKIVRDQFDRRDVYYVDVSNIDARYYDVSFDIDISSNNAWNNLSHGGRLDILDRISSDIFHYNNYDRVIIDISVDGRHWDRYVRHFND